MRLSFNSASFDSVAFILTCFNATELNVDWISDSCTSSLLPLCIAFHWFRVLQIPADHWRCGHSSESSSACYWHSHQVIDWIWGLLLGLCLLNVSVLLFSIPKPILKTLEGLAQQNLGRLVLGTQHMWKLWRSYGCKSDWQQISTGKDTVGGWCIPH